MAESLDEFNTWKVSSLKEFLSLRGLSGEGTKAELVALTYAASRLSLPCVPSQSEVLRLNKEDYDKILSTQDIPDPLALSEKWCDEKEGIAHWPPTFLSDIISYINTVNPTIGIVNKYLSEYKVGKAYEYFKSDWLKEVFYHNIKRDHPSCLLRAKCTPSQRLSDTDHDVWACIDKESGDVKAAYCTCTAGLGQTCNHVAGLLFRIESANRLGLTSCTSSKSKWTVPNEKSELHHKPLVEIDIVKSRSRSRFHEHSRPLVNTSKRNYRPVAEIPDIDQLIQNLKAVTPNSCMFKGFPDEKAEQPAAVTMDTSHAENVSEVSLEPPLIFDVSKHFLPTIVHHFKATKDNLHLNFMDFIPELTDEEQLSINFSTLGQFQNPEWVQIREGRITASNFYAVYTRVNSVLKKPGENVDNLLGMLCGYSKPNANIKSLKYGREMEPEAKKIYYQQYICNHQNVILSDCGIFLNKRCSYLAASPDALVTCSCCGDGVLEVKCLCIEECKKCSGFCHCTLPNCLYHTDGKLSLKHNHKYFAQVQAQMAFCNRQWCDFFIHTCNGTFIERIVFDQMYTEQLITNVKHFFAKYMVPELLSQSLKEKMSITSVNVGEDITGSIFFCPVCKSVIKEQENINSFSKRSICCDKCNKWYHFKCIKMTKTLLDKCKNKEWFCQNCE